MSTTILAIETSCDETAVAILRDREDHSGSELLASEVASQISEHEKFGGVVPEVAARNHLVQLPQLVQRALSSANIGIAEIDAFAATSGPGLASSLLVGNSAAKAMAIGTGKPFLAINHVEGHLLSPFFGRDGIEPNIALVVSGGHTMLVNVHAVANYEFLGRTVDDAAGEAFDKVAKLLGLSYPGGPEIERHARRGNPARLKLPRSMLDSGDLNFSFSGLKTAVRYSLSDPSLRHDLKDVCASFQQAVIDVLRAKSLCAVRETKSRMLTLSGGVSSNKALRDDLQVACRKEGIEFLVAEPWLCTDNAAMIAFAATLRFERGLTSKLGEEIDPNLALR